MRCLSRSPRADWPDFVGRACLRMPLREPTPRSDGRSCSLLPTSAVCPVSVWCSCESQGTPQVNCSVTDIILDGKGRKVQRILVLLCCTLTSAYDYSLLENFFIQHKYLYKSYHMNKFINFSNAILSLRISHFCD